MHEPFTPTRITERPEGLPDIGESFEFEYQTNDGSDRTVFTGKVYAWERHDTQSGKVRYSACVKPISQRVRRCLGMKFCDMGHLHYFRWTNSWLRRFQVREKKCCLCKGIMREVTYISLIQLRDCEPMNVDGLLCWRCYQCEAEVETPDQIDYNAYRIQEAKATHHLFSELDRIEKEKRYVSNS